MDPHLLWARLPCGLVEVDRSGRIAVCNRAYARLLGHDPEAMIGRHMWEFVVGQADKAACEDEFAAVLRDQPRPVPWLRTMRGRGGAARELRLDWDYVRDPAGRVERLSMIVTDVSEQQDADRAHRQAEERLRDFARVVSDRIWEMDQDLRFSFVSTGKSTGHPPAADFLGRTRWEMAGCDRDTDEKWRAHADDLMARRPFRDFRYATKGRDGQVSHWSVSGDPMFDANGRFRGYRGASVEITAAIEAESRAKRAEGYLAAALESMPSPIAIYDARQRLVMCNRAYRTCHRANAVDSDVRVGMTLKEVLRRNLLAGAYPEAVGREEAWLAERLGRFAEPKGPFELALWSGQWLLVQDHKLKNGGTMTLTTDITERKRATEAVRESEARFRSIFEQSRIPTGLAAPDWRFIRVNQAMCDMLGYTAAELEQMTFRDVTHPDDRERNAAYRRRTTAGEIDSFELEKRFVRKDGRVVWTNLNVTLVRDADGAELFSVGQIRDITERKIAQEALIESEARLYALIDNCPLIIAIKDLDGRLVYCNSAYERMVGRPLQQLLGKTVFDTAPRSLAERYRAHEREVLRSGQPIVREWTDVPAGRKRMILDLKFPFRDAAGAIAGIGYIGRDITDEKEAQAVLWAAKQEAEQANQSKTRFLAAASHDLRQPMQSMALLLHVLAGVDDAEERTQIIKDMGTSLNTMQSLLNTLLDISALEAGAVSPEPEVFPVQHLLDSVRSRFRSVAGEEGLELRTVRCGLHVHSDPRLLEQIVNNFVSNAVRYTEKGRLLIGCRRRSAVLEIAVFDTGVGIPEDQQSAIFEDFYQLDNPARDRSKGLGLGLAIADRTAKLLGVRLSAASNLSRGSRFSVLVPIAETAPDGLAAAAPAPAMGAAVMQDKFVAVVEDDAAIANAMRLLLGKEGFSTVTAATGAEIAARLAEQDRTPDLVISDYRLPSSETGVDVVAAIRCATRPDLPGIIITGDTTVEILRIIEAAGLQHLYKPVDPVALRNLIIDALTTDGPPI